MNLIRSTIGIAALAIAIAACSGTSAAPATASTPPVDEATATEILESAMDGFNRADYAAWSRDWSDLMRSAIDEGAFLEMRSALLPTTGRFVAVKDVRYAETKPGVHRYTFSVAFEKIDGTVWLGFVSGSPKVEGIKFE